MPYFSPSAGRGGLRSHGWRHHGKFRDSLAVARGNFFRILAELGCVPLCFPVRCSGGLACACPVGGVRSVCVCSVCVPSAVGVRPLFRPAPVARCGVGSLFAPYTLTANNGQKNDTRKKFFSKKIPLRTAPGRWVIRCRDLPVFQNLPCISASVLRSICCIP